MDFDELDELLGKYVFSANFDGDASEERKEIHEWARRAILSERQRCADLADKEAEGYKANGFPQAALGCITTRKAILN